MRIRTRQLGKPSFPIIAAIVWVQAFLLATRDYPPLWGHTWLELGIIVGGMAIIAGLAAIKDRKNRLTLKRQSRGLCLVCGYDLRASPVRCPECGTEISGGESAGN
jgi:hypothetical protein